MSDIRPEDLQSLVAALSQGDQRGAQVNAAMTGANAGQDRALEQRKADFQMKLEKAGLIVKQRDTASTEAKTGLDFKKAQQPSTVFDPSTGKTTTTPGMSGIDFQPGVGLTQTPDASVGEKGPKILPNPAAKPTDVAVFDQDTGTFTNQDGTPRTTPIDPSRTKIIPHSRPPSGGAAADPSTLLANLKQTEEILKKVPSGIVGAGASVASKVTGGAVFPDTKLYEDTKPATSVSIYRAVTKDNRLSDGDAQARALPLMPSTYDSPELRSKKLLFLKTALQNSIAGKTTSPDAFTLAAQQLGGSGTAGQVTPEEARAELKRRGKL